MSSFTIHTLRDSVQPPFLRRLTHPAFNSQVAFGVWFAAKPGITPKIVSGNRFDQHSPSPLDCLLYSTLLFIPRFLSLFHDFIVPYLYVFNS